MKKLLLLSLFFIAPQTALCESALLGLGPVGFTNPYPLAVSQLTVQPTSPAVIAKPGEFQARTSFSWANTYNDDRQLTVDAETKNVLQSLTVSLSEDTDFSVKLPLHWRGGGVADSAIDNWHSFFGLPRGGRDKVDNDRFRIRGINEDGSTFAIEKGAPAIGDLQFHTKTILLENPFSDTLLSGSFAVSVPSGAKRYSNEGAEMLAQLLLARKLYPFVIYSGIGFAHSTEDNYQEAKIRRNRPGGFISVEYLLNENSSLGASYTIAAHPNAPVQLIPDTEQYIDLFLSYNSHDFGLLELAIRENPASGNTTTDITMLLSLTTRWNELPGGFSW